MEEYAGRVLADRYRLPRMPVGEEPAETPAFDTYSGQEVLARQVRLPEVVSAEVLFAHVDSEDPPDVLGPDDDPGQRALRAAMAAARIPDHPRLVQVYDVLLDSGSLWIISERVSARPLAELMAERQISPYRAAEIGSDVLTALRAVHSHAWIHRNVTAETVLVCDDGRAMLTGLAVGAAEEALCGLDPVPTTAPGAGEAAYGEEGDDAHGEEGGGATDPLDGFPGQRDPLGQHRGAAAYPTPTHDAYGSAGAIGAAPGELDVIPAPGPVAAHLWERAREVRFDVVGAVTERWAPEQAGPLPVRLPSQGGLPDWAEPVSVPVEHSEVGPPADMWALGALLFRAIQGHPPFPEDDAHQLAELVRNEPPAFAEDCGPLRPIVESLLRKDPHTRPDLEEVRGWLRSLIRTAPEPDIGRETVEMPADDSHKVVEVRRRGDVARRNRPGVTAVHHGRHARAKGKARKPRRLGMLLVGLVLLLLGLALVVAVLLLPREDEGSGGSGQRDTRSSVGSTDTTDGAGSTDGGDDEGGGEKGSGDEAPTRAPDFSTDVELHRDPAGFEVMLSRDLISKGTTDSGRVLFSDGDDVQVVFAPGVDSAEKSGGDPFVYQDKEQPELRPFRTSTWATKDNSRRLKIDGDRAVQCDYSWRDKNNRGYYARNLVILRDGKYHVVYVEGPERDRADISRFFEKAAATYRVTD